jgi:hypothetical protein
VRIAKELVTTNADPPGMMNEFLEEGLRYQEFIKRGKTAHDKVTRTYSGKTGPGKRDDLIMCLQLAMFCREVFLKEERFSEFW